MTRFSFDELQDVALLAHYHLYKQGVYDSLPASRASRSYKFYLVDATEFEKSKVLESLKFRSLLKLDSGRLPIISGQGIAKVEKDLRKTNSFLNKNVANISCFHREDTRPLLRISLGASDESGNDDTVLSVAELSYGAEWVNQNIAPVADGFVTLDHNSQSYKAAISGLDTVIQTARESNQLGERDAAEKERIISELEAGKRLLESPKVNVRSVSTLIGATLLWLAGEFAAAPVGEAAQYAWSLIKPLIGL